MAPGTTLGAASPVGAQGENIGSTEEAKVKNVLTGEAPTDAEAQAMQGDPSNLPSLIDAWMKTPAFQAKMFRFFQNAFQQTQLNRASLADQIPDIGSVDARMLDNIQNSFAMTVIQLTLNEGKPFTDALTTDRRRSR